MKITIREIIKWVEENKHYYSDDVIGVDDLLKKLYQLEEQILKLMNFTAGRNYYFLEKCEYEEANYYTGKNEAYKEILG
ncbi:hypothetical protein J7M02_02640 [Candidatus Aerophobetes bacterium]|nr:hypothetical protein [Candidatus Aerophobetes bacterium]